MQWDFNIEYYSCWENGAMSRGRRKKDTQKTLELLIGILFAIPLAIIGIFKWLLGGSKQPENKSVTNGSSRSSLNNQYSSKSSQCSNSMSPEPYRLNKNDLTQGEYVIGKDIPVGVYDFFVVYGNGGKFDIAKYDDNDKIIDGTWAFYWVGLQETYEKKELIHIDCKAGYTVKISGNVVLKIVKSQAVRIEL